MGLIPSPFYLFYLYTLRIESAKKYNDALYILKQNPKFDNAYGIEALNSLPPGKKPGTTDEDVDQWARGYYKQHGQYDNYDGLVLISRKLYPDWKAGKITDRKYLHIYPFNIELFGNTKCGVNNFLSYLVYNPDL